MAKKYGCYAEDMIEMAKNMLIDEIRDDLQSFIPENKAYGVLVGIAGKVTMTDKFIAELKTEKDDDR